MCFHFIWQGDVVVIACSPDLNLKQGGSGSSILRAAGQQLQDDFNENYPDKVEQGTIAEGTQCTGAMFKRVFATSLPHWYSKDVDKNKVCFIVSLLPSVSSKPKVKCFLFF